MGEPTTIRLTVPTIIEASSTLGFYIHVAVPHDSGSAYQSFANTVRILRFNSFDCMIIFYLTPNS